MSITAITPIARKGIILAGGSGTRPEEVSQLAKQFTTINALAKNMAGMSAMAKVRAVKELGAKGGMGGLMPGLEGMPGLGMRSKGSTATPSIKSRFKKRK